MKKNYHIYILMVISGVLFSSQMQSQWGNWSDPISVTNSTEDNKNATIGFLHFIENDHYIFWERSTDTLSTSIVYKRFYQNDEPEVLISKEGVHFKHPQIISK